MSKSQRTKGAAGEREFFALLSQALGLAEPVRRQLGQARDGGHDGQCGNFRIEVKRRAHIAMLRWMEQCCTGAAATDVPVVAMREDNGEWHVLLRAPHFFSLMQDHEDAWRYRDLLR